MGEWMAGIAGFVLGGLILAGATAKGRRIAQARRTKRQPRWRAQPRVDRTGLSVHLKMVWLMDVEALDVQLTPVRPVKQTSSGGSSRQVLGKGDVVQAVFSWDESSEPVTATLTWREQGSTRGHSETLHLDAMVKPS